MGRTGLFWLLFAVTLGAYLAMVVWSGPVIIRDTGGLLPFDVRPFGYSEAEARTFLMALSGLGRAFYLGPQQWIDTVFPGLLAVTLGFAIAWVGRDWNGVLRAGFILAAFLGAGFDYLENHLVANMLRESVADLSGADIAAASQMTVLKYSFDAVAFSGLLVGLAGLAIRRWCG